MTMQRLEMTIPPSWNIVEHVNDILSQKGIEPQNIISLSDTDNGFGLKTIIVWYKES